MFLLSVKTTNQYYELIAYIQNVLKEYSVHLLDEKKNCTLDDCFVALMKLEDDPLKYSAWCTSIISKLKEKHALSVFLDVYEGFLMGDNE